MEFLSDYGLFLLKAVTIVIAILFVISGIVNASQKNKSQEEGEIHITNISEELCDIKETLQKEILSKEDYQKLKKAEKKQQKLAKKKKGAEKEETKLSARLFVLDFDGDIKASAVDNLREEISALLSIVRAEDEVLLRLESSGGMVHAYGLAAAQLLRLRKSVSKLTISVDKVAASGGYMMACVAHEIIAAPFAILGSIGVLAELPNFNRLLRKHDVDYEQHTAGEFKRTLTMFGENTDAGREKFREEIEETHQLFKHFVKEQRDILEIDTVATGETWYGSQAVDNRLVDQIMTSDDFILDFAERGEVFALAYEFKKPLAEKLGLSIHALFDKVLRAGETSINRRSVER